MHREKLDITKHHKDKNWSNRLPTLKLMISCDLNTKLIHFHDDFRQKWSANPHFHVRTKVNNHTSIVFLLKTLKFHENLHFFSKISEKGRVWEKIHCYWDFWMLKLDRFDGFWRLRSKFWIKSELRPRSWARRVTLSPRWEFGECQRLGYLFPTSPLESRRAPEISFWVVWTCYLASPGIK